MESPDDQAAMVDYDAASVVMAEHPDRYAGVGLCIHDGLVFIDLDDALDPSGAVRDPWCADLLADAEELSAFIEISQSGRGLHIIGLGHTATAGHKGVGIEVYGSRRFVAITGTVWGAAPAALGDITELADRTRAEHAERVRSQRAERLPLMDAPVPDTPPRHEKPWPHVLSAFDPADREVWFKVGLALGRAFPDDAAIFEHYRQWAMTAPNYVAGKDDRTMQDIFQRQAKQPSGNVYTLDLLLADAAERGKHAALFTDDFETITAPDVPVTPSAVIFGWDRHALTADELVNRAPDKRFIIDRMLPAARTAMIGRGGLGKTMLLLYEALHVAAGMTLYGEYSILEPGRVLFVTAEEERPLLSKRAAMLLDRLAWYEDVKEHAFTSVAIQDVSSHIPRLISQQKSGEFAVTAWVQKFIEGYQHAGIRWVIFDPVSAFGLNENAMNDSAMVMMEAATRISNGLGGCAVTFVHHTSKGDARGNVVDAHSGRGGSAFGDASRSTRVLTGRANLPAGTPIYDLETRTSRLTLHQVKNSYAAPQPAIDLDIVDGYQIAVAAALLERTHVDFWMRVGEVIRQEEEATGFAPSIETLTRAGSFGMRRDAVRQKLMNGVAERRLTLVAHPTDKRKRGVVLNHDFIE